MKRRTQQHRIRQQLLSPNRKPSLQYQCPQHQELFLKKNPTILLPLQREKMGTLISNQMAFAHGGWVPENSQRLSCSF